MKKTNGIVVILMLIAIINIGCMINLFWNGDNSLAKINMQTSIIVLVMQIIALIISTIILKKNVKTKKMVLIVMAILITIFITTFFIPVSAVSVYLHGEISSFYPIEIEKNIYNITI